MGATAGPGLPPKLPDESYLDYMDRCYQQQRPEYTSDERKVQARFPSELYRVAWSYMKKHGLSQTTYLRLAATQFHLLND